MNWALTAEIATTILGVVAFAGILGYIGRHVFGFIRKIVQFLDSWLGEPPRDGLAARPGVMERLTNLEATTVATAEAVGAIQAELPKNGVPLAMKIDKLWGKFLTDEERERALQQH